MSENKMGIQSVVDISLRDYFAAKAMQGLLISSSEYGIEEQDCAKYAYQYADAMLAERERGE